MPHGEVGAPSPTQEEIMAEEAAKKAIKDKIRQEYFGALSMEGSHLLNVE